MIDLRKRRLAALPLLAAVALFPPASFAAFGATARAAAPRPPALAGATTTIASRHTKAGVILVDPGGQTLFLFTRDQHGTSTCYRRCAREWRPLRASGRLIAKRGSGVKQRWLSTTRRRDGTLQVTYDHYPLYVHAGNKPGSLNGDHTSEFGGRWYVMPIVGPEVSGWDGAKRRSRRRGAPVIAATTQAADDRIRRSASDLRARVPWPN